MPKRRKTPRPPRTTFYPSQQATTSSVFGNDRASYGWPSARG